MILDKINQFSEGKYTVDVSAAQIAGEYEEKRGDSAAVIEALSITQRFVSTCEQPAPRFPTYRRDLILFPASQLNSSLSTDKRVLQQPPSAAQHRRHRRRPPYLRRPPLPHPPLSALGRPPRCLPLPTNHRPLRTRPLPPRRQHPPQHQHLRQRRQLHRSAHRHHHRLSSPSLLRR